MKRDFFKTKSAKPWPSSIIKYQIRQKVLIFGAKIQIRGGMQSFNILVVKLRPCILFENYSKCLILIF